MLFICIFFLDQYYLSFVSLISLYDVQLLTLLIFSVYFLLHFAFIQFLVFYFIFFSFCVVDLQCCVSLMCTAKWFGYIYICIYSYIFIFLYMLCLVAQSCLTLCDAMGCSPPGSSVHGILQARILEWIAMPSSRGSSQHRDRTQVFHVAGGFFTIWATREALVLLTVTQMCQSPSHSPAFAFIFFLPGEFFPSWLPGSLTHFLLVHALSPYQRFFLTALSKTASLITIMLHFY